MMQKGILNEMSAEAQHMKSPKKRLHRTTFVEVERLLKTL